MIETELEVLYLGALLLLVDCICCFIAACRRTPVLGAVAGGGTAGALALVLLARIVPFPLAAIVSIVIGGVIAWVKAKSLEPRDNKTAHGGP
ncbi:hypothetical protein DM872_07955 [Pseudomonas taiwanensis]|uniref:hypothetical protein n=1 Tax=Pseudomonas taiwanensis TaxID=470150 RepID=UPI0015BF82CC|nr:hypothetical protein [Pseudomonas taiwanensis]